MLGGRPAALQGLGPLHLRWLGLVALMAGAWLVVAVPGLRLHVGVLLIAAVAYVNGANDISRAIATLVGSGTASPRRAVAWGTAMTLVGALLSIFTGAALVAVFSSALVSDGTSPTYAFAIGATVGTAAWVGLATRLGLPVSTTHALTGSVVLSAALVFGPEAVRWPVLAGAVLLPLLVSPLLGVAFGGLLVTTTRRIPSGGDRALAAVHWASSGLTAMARAMNDAPKLVALGALLWLAADGRSFGLGASVGVGVMVACAMALGSYLGGRRVTDTLAHRLTRMNHREGTAANVATAALVTLAATNGLPVSTTQVAGGSIAGIGLAARDGRTSHSVVREIALAWLVTAPGAGLIAATAAWLAGAL